MNNREFFNSMAEKWDNTVYHDAEKIKTIINKTGIRKEDIVLDVGTGTGVMIPFLLSGIGEEGKIIAVDIAEKMVEVAKRKYPFPNVEFITGDVFEIILPENYFDVIMCYSVFPHFQDKCRGIMSLSKYLNKKGKMVICHSQSRDAINKLHKNMDSVVAKDNLPPAETIRQYFILAGMSMIVEADNDEMFIVIGKK